MREPAPASSPHIDATATDCPYCAPQCGMHLVGRGDDLPQVLERILPYLSNKRASRSSAGGTRVQPPDARVHAGA